MMALLLQIAIGAFCGAVIFICWHMSLSWIVADVAKWLRKHKL